MFVGYDQYARSKNYHVLMGTQEHFIHFFLHLYPTHMLTCNTIARITGHILLLRYLDQK